MAKEPYRYAAVPMNADFERLACNTENQWKSFEHAKKRISSCGKDSVPWVAVSWFSAIAGTRRWLHTCVPVISWRQFSTWLSVFFWFVFCFGEWTGGSGVASLAQEERREPHIELLSGLKNGSNTEGQPQLGSVLGPSSAVLRSLPAAVDFFRNCSNHHPQLRIQVPITYQGFLHIPKS